MMRSPRPIRYAARSCFGLLLLDIPGSILPPIPSRMNEYPSFFGTTTMMGILPSITPFARVSICFVLYTDIASYTERRIRSRMTGTGSSDIPNIDAIPAARRTPRMSTTYHSGYFHNRNVAAPAQAVPITSADSADRMSPRSPENT
ncbi:MAG: hypothetical protein BWY45_02582 [Euryarchaeota archaeon ADurb.Bin294]|nr:MAG: hypothetical protein BWY45_02582 [Euryarchaeota archaeon ADurb.Bin294]